MFIVECFPVFSLSWWRHQSLAKPFLICWPVFSSVDRFGLKQNTVFSRFFFRDISALFLGNMSRVRKYRFALCFRVLSNQYVERSAYANVFKFNRENERFKRGKLNSRCFWFPAAMLESHMHGVSVLLGNTIIFGDIFCRITRVRNIAHPRNLGTLFNYYSSTIFQFLDSIY